MHAEHAGPGQPHAVTPARLTQILEAYGSEPARWPEGERAAAMQCLQAHPEAAALLEQAAQLDGMLDSWLVPAPTPRLRASILAQVPAPRRNWARMLQDLWDELGGWRLAAPTFAASLMVGVLLPLQPASFSGDLPDDDLLAWVESIDEGAEWLP